MQDYLHAYPIVYLIFVIVFSFLVTVLAIPSILHVARERHLYDDLGSFRKHHDHGIPRLGGIAIFVSFTITILSFAFADKSLPVNYLLTACIILFAMGVKDDLTGVNSNTKFLLQFIVASILVVLGDIRVTSMYGIFGVYNLEYFVSVPLSTLLIMLIVNAFNLIDGIDGLASVTGIIVNGAFAALFVYMKHYELAAVGFAMVGATTGFLRFNLSPAKIFMGDTGSLLIGLISAVMALKFIELNKFVDSKSSVIYCAPALAFAVLIGPIFDTLRVFTLRIAKGDSPFKADRNHMHHRILILGFSHIQTTVILACLTIVSIGMVVICSSLGNSTLIVAITFVSLLFNWMVTFLTRSKERENMALRNLFA
jgi:UDP-N-acetylmuramyl pentapeptide phosphotransferase/UDP-N-acetylglucosamine-1-phosphate transferase